MKIAPGLRGIGSTKVNVCLAEEAGGIPIIAAVRILRASC